MAMQFSKEDQEKLKQDTSEIYKKRTKETNEEDIANLSGKGKLQQFKDYYLKTVVVVVLVICLVVAGIVNAVFFRETTVLYVAIYNDIIMEEQIPAFEAALEEYLGLGDGEVVTVSIDGTAQQLQTYFYAGTADILIAGEEDFAEWAQAEYFFASNKNDEVSFYTGYDESYLYYAQYVTSEDVRNNTETENTETEASDPTEYNCGLYLTDSEKYRQLGGGYEKPVIGISLTTEHLSEAKKFVKYMMDNTITMELDTAED